MNQQSCDRFSYNFLNKTTSNNKNSTSSRIQSSNQLSHSQFQLMTSQQQPIKYKTLQLINFVFNIIIKLNAFCILNAAIE